jgi:hypothetical protein
LCGRAWDCAGSLTNTHGKKEGIGKTKKRTQKDYAVKE